MSEQDRLAFQNSFRNHNLTFQKQREIGNNHLKNQGVSNNGASSAPDKGEREKDICLGR